MDSKETQPPSTASQPPPPPPQSTPSQTHPPPLPSQHPPQPSTIPQPTTSIPTPENPQNPNPNNPPIPSSTTHPQQSIHNNHQSQIRPPPMNNRIRPLLPQPQPHFPTPNTVTSTPHLQRGGVAIGVPAAHASRPPTPSASQQQQPSHFSSFGPSSYTTQFSRNPVNVPETLTPNQMKSVHPGIQNIGMMGSISSGSISHLQNRTVVPSPSSMRPPAPASNQSLAATQKYQSHEQPHVLQRVSTTSSPSPASPAGMQPQLTQQWMSSTGPGRPMHSPTLTSPSYRQQMRPPTLSQRSHIPQQHPHSYSAVSHQMPSAPQQQQHQQPSQPNQSQEHYNQQFPPTRVPQPSPHPALGLRGLAPGSLKTSITSPSGINNSTFSADPGETSNHILSKRSIHELITQIDPSEKVDPEVEDILVDIAEDFVESVTTFACSLAKHRKSNVLEAKDILLHLEKNWNMSLPGFGGDEIKNYKKPYTNEIHRERLAAIKKSMVLSDAAAYAKRSVGVATGAAKGHTAKAAPAP